MLRFLLLLAVLAGVAVLARTVELRPASVSSSPPLPTVAPFGERPVGRDAVTVTLDEAGLTSQVNAMLGGQAVADTPFGPAVVRDLAVHVEEGLIKATGTAQAGLVGLPVELRFSIEALDGRLLVALRSASVGAIPLPEPARLALEQSVQAPVDQLVAQQRVRIHSAAMHPGRLILVAAQ